MQSIGAAFISNGKAIANLFDVIRRKCLYPNFRGFFAWAGAQTAEIKRNTRWVQYEY
jgi:hypothetical protein